MEVKGCIHVHIRDGSIVNVFSHLTNLPKNCVVHLVPDMVLPEEEFERSHPCDAGEIRLESKGTIFDLGDRTV